MPFIPRSKLTDNISCQSTINNANKYKINYQKRVKRNFDKHVPKKLTVHSENYIKNEPITHKLQQQYLPLNTVLNEQIDIFPEYPPNVPENGNHNNDIHRTPNQNVRPQRQIHTPKWLKDNYYYSKLDFD
ncbi:hypothetical protein A3Q56_08328 [Intoshia linei]|uniref:Uncharacterized protein n=1 Tax=Intoshia linei TaxID=1819745 RepID=A0A177APM1_9BILA|nr:hypothetical protein A3Q56_08328 [Intoshia linei]